MKFKVGDIVLVKNHRDAGTRRIVQAAESRVYPYTLDSYVKGLHNAYSDSELELAKSLDNLSSGDVLRRPGIEAYDRIVLAVSDEFVVTIDSDDNNIRIEPLIDIKNNGWTLKGDEPEKKIKEMTLEEVASLVGVPVEQIRIKD